MIPSSIFQLEDEPIDWIFHPSNAPSASSAQFEYSTTENADLMTQYDDFPVGNLGTGFDAWESWPQPLASTIVEPMQTKSIHVPPKPKEKPWNPTVSTKRSYFELDNTQPVNQDAKLIDSIRWKCINLGPTKLQTSSDLMTVVLDEAARTMRRLDMEKLASQGTQARRRIVEKSLAHTDDTLLQFVRNNVDLIDWKKIGQQVEMDPFHCRQQVLLTPSKPMKWKKKDDLKLLRAVDAPKTMDWIQISKKLGASPLECFKRFLKLQQDQDFVAENASKPHEYLPIFEKEVVEEKDFMEDYLHSESESETANSILTASTRTSTLRSSGVSDGEIMLQHEPREWWTTEEDDLLRKGVEQYGTSDWKQISKQVPGKRPQQCRDRYMNRIGDHLNTKPWTPDEDSRLMTIVKQLRGKGRPKGGFAWKTVSQRLGTGRTTQQLLARHKVLSKHKK